MERSESAHDINIVTFQHLRSEFAESPPPILESGVGWAIAGIVGALLWTLAIAVIVLVS